MFGENYLTSSLFGFGMFPPATVGARAADRDIRDRRKMDLSYRDYPISVWVYETVAYFGQAVCSSSTAVRRRFHSRRSCMTLISTFLFTIVIYHLMISTLHNITRSRRSSSSSLSSRYLSEAMHAGQNESTNFTEHLWLFKNSDAERIYLYTKLLGEYKWKLNKEYLHLFRKEINASPNSTLDYLVMTQENVRIGEKIPTYVPIKTILPQEFIVDENFMSSLPRKSPIGDKQYKRCAVVGNSGSLRNTSCGAEIDDMDYVFRCNAAPLDEFRQDAGLKTNFITFNPSILFKHFGGIENDSMIEMYVQYMRQYNGIVWYPCFGSSKLIPPCLQAISYHDRINAQLVIGHPTHYANLWDFWIRRGMKKKPSTGLYMMTTAIAMCEEVHLYGFWPFPVQMTPQGNNFTEIPYHYFNDLPFTSKYHQTDLEFRILIQLHMLGVINMHYGSCNS